MMNDQEIADSAFDQAMSRVVDVIYDEQNEVVLQTHEVYQWVFGLFQNAAANGTPMPQNILLEKAVAGLSHVEILELINRDFEDFEYAMRQARDSGEQARATMTNGEYLSLCKLIAHLDRVDKFFARAVEAGAPADAIPKIDNESLASLRACIFRADHGNL